MAAQFLVRENGTPTPIIDVDMIGSNDGKTVLVRVTLKKGASWPNGTLLENDYILFESRVEQ
jgi:hypothetical protein